MSNVGPYQVFVQGDEKSVNRVGERVLIALIRDWVDSVGAPAPSGIGDDCAVCESPEQATRELITIDGVCWGRHFDASVAPESVGRKLVARNLSDIAAMGGEPQRAVVGLWLAPQTGLEWLRRFHTGMVGICHQFGVQIVGGDVATAPEGVFIADLCMTGVCRKPALRGLAATGDSIWVTGSLGGSMLGKHHAFEPRLREGQWLAAHAGVKSMMDVSDGLAKDLPSLVAGRKIVLERERIPVSEDAIRLARITGQDPLYHGLSDGEDFELVFVVEGGVDETEFLRAWCGDFELPVSCIGRVATDVSVGPEQACLEMSGESEWRYGSGYEHLG